MSSPLPKGSDKQRKMKATTNKATTNNLDTRTELAELVKRKAEISVSFSIQSIIMVVVISTILVRFLLL